MKMFRAGLCALVLAAAGPFLVACSGGADAPGNQPSTSVSSASTEPSAGAPDPSGSSDPTSSTSTSANPSAEPTSSDQPVPKVKRNEETGSPTIKAKPAKVDKPVRYSDGVSLKIRSIDFAKETKKGPGSFPGRAYAVLTLEVANKSTKNLSMSTVVITVLDKKDKAVAPVYADEAKVQDFSGTLKAGKTTKARYAFAVPKSSRNKVTVVVDFDGAHTSAVFRGKLT